MLLKYFFFGSYNFCHFLVLSKFKVVNSICFSFFRDSASHPGISHRDISLNEILKNICESEFIDGEANYTARSVHFDINLLGEKLIKDFTPIRYVDKLLSSTKTSIFAPQTQRCEFAFPNSNNAICEA